MNESFQDRRRRDRRRAVGRQVGSQQHGEAGVPAENALKETIIMYIPQ